MIKVLVATTLVLILAGCASKSPAPVEDRSQSMRSAAPVPSGPGYHTVKKGETLYSIALEYGQDYREVASWNNIADPNRIAVGQSLRVMPPGGSDGTVAAPIVAGSVVEQRSLDPVAIPASTNNLKREPKVNKEPYSDGAYARLASPVGVAKPSEVKPADTKPEGVPDDKPVADNGTTGIAWAWPAPGKVMANYGQTKGVDIGGRAGDPVQASADGKVVYAGTGLRGYGQLVIIKHDATYLSAYAHNQKILVKEGQTVSRGQKIAEMGSTDSDSVKLHFEVRRQGKPVDPLEFLPKR